MKKLFIGILALTLALATVSGCTHMKNHQQCPGTKVGNKR